MKKHALMFLLVAIILTLGSSHAIGQAIGKKIVDSGAMRFSKPAVLNPDTALPAGVYTVGQGGHFPTLDSAFHKLNSDGVLGNVTLTLIDTLYEALHGRRFELGPIAGAGPSARITIRPAVGTYATVRGDSDAVFFFRNTKYVTLDGHSNPPSPSSGIFVHALYNPASIWNDCVDAWGDADHNEFLYLSLKSDDPRATFTIANCIGLLSEGSNSPDSNLVEGNSTSGTIGIYVWGSATSRPQHNVIRGNAVGSASDLLAMWGIYIERAMGTVIEGNTIQFMRRAAFPDFTLGINAYATLNTIIRNNVVHDLIGSSGARLAGIQGSGASTAVGQGLQIYNNMVYNLQNSSTTGNAYIEGIVSWYNADLLVAYNSVRLDGTGQPPRGADALGLDAGCTNATVRNNILVNTYHATAGLGCTAMWMNNLVSFTSDYNDLYVDTTYSNSWTVWTYNGAQYRTLGAWQGTGRDLHSVSVIPPFIGPDDLHIVDNVETPIADGATPLAGISGDIDGNVRPHIGHLRPDIGADEFDHLVAVEEGEDGIPGSFALSQNYPNPFNPTTAIQFAIVNRQSTIVKVYDVLGREVATLVNEVKGPGTYTVQWDASGVSSGVYFYRLRAGDFVQTKRMILVR